MIMHPYTQCDRCYACLHLSVRAWASVVLCTVLLVVRPAGDADSEEGERPDAHAEEGAHHGEAREVAGIYFCYC
jgi:hypothetical protein